MENEKLNAFIERMKLARDEKQCRNVDSIVSKKTANKSINQKTLSTAVDLFNRLRKLFNQKI